MDVVGPLPKSRRGNRFILVLCDYATRFLEAIPMSSVDAEAVAEELVNLFSKFGIPTEILSDQGANFMSRLLKELYNLMHILCICTSPYHPQSDGLVERFNKTLKSLLRKFVKGEGKDWDLMLPYLLFAYREVPQESTGFLPFELMFGRDIRGPLDVLKEEWIVGQRSNQSVVSHILSIHEKLEAMYELARIHLEEAQRQQKHWYDKKAREQELHPGEEVLLLLPTSTSKLLAQRLGPCYGRLVR